MKEGGVCEFIVKLIEKDYVHTERWTVINVFITITLLYPMRVTYIRGGAYPIVVVLVFVGFRFCTHITHPVQLIDSSMS